MAYSFFGVHTFDLFTSVVEGEAPSIMADFRRYRDKTNEIKIITNKKYPNSYEIKYHGGKGLTWRIRYSHEWHGISIYCIDAIVNPKVLSCGFPDYFNSANHEEIQTALSKLPDEARKISGRLYELFPFRINRVDYCINFDMDRLQTGCTVEQMMELIKRGDIPHHFEEFMKYDKISHRMKSDQATFYLKSCSVVVNCYLKGEQLKRKYPQTPNISSNIIRFEIQCMRTKVFHINKNPLEYTGEAIDYMLSGDTAEKVLTNYFNRIIKKGQYYTLADAGSKIMDCQFKTKKEDRLLTALKIISLSRGIAKAKEKLNSDEAVIFSRALRELAELGINPVTIPREWGIKRIDNLLEAHDAVVKHEKIAM